LVLAGLVTFFLECKPDLKVWMRRCCGSRKKEFDDVM